MYLLKGDFYQLFPVNKRSLIYEQKLSNSVETNAGRLLWEKINYFNELKHNFRADTNDLETKFYVKFLSDARIGNVSDSQLTRINGSCVQLNIKEAIMKTNVDTKSIWLTNTKEKRANINNIFKKILKEKKINISDNNGVINTFKNLSIDIICTHSHKDGVYIDKSTSINLHKINIKNHEGFDIPPAILSLSIGSRVQVIGNIGIEIGFNNNINNNINNYYYYYNYYYIII